MAPPRFSRRIDRSTRRLQARRPLVEALEGRQLLSTFTVTNVNDSGTGSLRQAILSSNAASGTATNTVTFNIGSGGTQTIALKSALPAVTHPVVIDGTTQPGTSTTLRVVLVGSGAGSTAVGLNLEANGSTIKGLAIDDFADGGVLVSGVSGDSIADDYIGVNAAGNAAAGNGNFGVRLSGGASGNSVADDVISGNNGYGVSVNGANLNVIAGDFIGTDATGTYALGNKQDGVLIDTDSSENLIGGTASGSRDVLSGNGLRGVELDSGAEHNTIEGDYIGTDHNGTQPLGNGVITRGGYDFSGILINGANDNVVGGSVAAARNVISANGYDAIRIVASGTVVEGNYIGTDYTGTQPLGNQRYGVEIDAGSTDNTIGGTAAAASNLIASNLLGGVFIYGAGKGNLVEGDTIEDNGNSTSPGDGVYINDTAYTTVSGCTIENNCGWGILVTSNSSKTTLSGNLVTGNHKGNISGG
jgi:titin